MRTLAIAARRIVSIALVLSSGFATHPAGAQTAPAADWGRHQSPVNISDPGGRMEVDKELPAFTGTNSLRTPLTFTFKNTTGGHWCKACESDVDQRWGALKAYPPDGSAPVIQFGGAPYILREFHFHVPAEHLLNHELAAMEMHFVFQRMEKDLSCPENEFVVIGERFKEGEPGNAELGKIFTSGVKLPKSYKDGTVDIGDIVVSMFLSPFPASTSYRYLGSLTAPAELPACGARGNPDEQLKTGVMPEVVSWVLETHVGTISPRQLVALRALFPNGDARSPQLLDQEVKKGADSRAK